MNLFKKVCRWLNSDDMRESLAEFSKNQTLSEKAATDVVNNIIKDGLHKTVPTSVIANNIVHILKKQGLVKFKDPN